MAKGHKNESTEAKHWGGAARSSAEIAVMAMERRGCIKQLDLIYNWIYSGGYIGEDKTIYHTKALGDESVQAYQIQCWFSRYR